MRIPAKTLIPLALALLLSAADAAAAVDLVTIPDRQHVQLTIYDHVDLTLARERRELTFRKGTNRIQFTWSNTLIDPTSLRIRVLEHAGEVEVLDTTFPPNRRDTLQWNVESRIEGPVPVEISYFTSGISWTAEYVGIANEAGTEMALRGYVRVANASGEEYGRARTQLVVGSIHLLEKIADLARGSFREFTREQRDQAIRYFLDAEAKYHRIIAAGGGRGGVATEGLSEYFLFRIPGEETVRDGWAKRLPAIEEERVPVETYHRLSDATTGGKVVRYLTFANRELPGAGSLGAAPLPGGTVRIFGRLPSGDLAWRGQDRTRYVPKGDRIVLDLGPDPDVVAERRLSDYRRTDIRLDSRGRVKHYREHWYWVTRVRNSKPVPVRLEVERKIPSNHAVKDLRGAERFEKTDEHVRRLYLELGPGEERTVRYRIVAEH